MNAEAHLQDSGMAYQRKLRINRLGLWLFLVSDAFMFGGLMVARGVLWGDTRPDLNQTLGLMVTAVLLVSSFFMNRAETAMAHGDKKEFIRGTVITLVLGIIFLVGVVGLEWPLATSHGITPEKDVHGAVFYAV